MQTCEYPNCTSNGDLSCACNTKLRFCNTHYMIHKRTQGNHSIILAQDLMITAKAAERLTQIEDLKKTIISKGKTMIKAIEDQITFFLHLVSLKKQEIENILTSQDIHDDFYKALDANIEDKGYDIKTFPDIVKNYLRVKINAQELNPPNINIQYLIEENMNLVNTIKSNQDYQKIQNLEAELSVKNLKIEEKEQLINENPFKNRTHDKNMMKKDHQNFYPVGKESYNRNKHDMKLNNSYTISANGKHYCGKPTDLKCKCCNGLCGPTNGCNCSGCQKLDIETRRLPPGCFVNKLGSVCKINNGVVYCGLKVDRPTGVWNGYCGPNNGPNCLNCQAMQIQLRLS
jgi:hypothetical protein